VLNVVMYSFLRIYKFFCAALDNLFEELKI
jgi:hypothetical protein